MKRLVILFLLLSLGGCMTVNITAREGSTVTVNQDKPVSTTGTATIPSVSK
jgi:hypothetical protein